MNAYYLFRTKTCCSLLITGLLVFSATQALAADEKKTAVEINQDVENQQASTQKSFVYKPPQRGAPGARVGAGTRGQGLNGTRLYVLTPDHAAWTINAQPDLYWYVSAPGGARYQFAIIEDTSLKTVLESQLKEIARPGIQKTSLKDHNISLKPGVEYQWFVSVVEDETQRSADIVASGIIERVEIENRLASRLASDELADVEKAMILAGESIWYDALASISAGIELKPEDKMLRGMRAALLEQAGLSEVASYDRQILN